MKILGLKVIMIGAILYCAASCGSAPDAQRIIDQVIENHGGVLYENFKASFDFRGRHYVMQHQGGSFQYERHFSDHSGQIKDIINNEGFRRLLNDQDITDTVKKAAAYARSVNSVAYFALLPYRLNDPAVNKFYLGIGEIKGVRYHKIQVTFEQKGGGDDYSDEFVYWIHAENLTMEYFAYLYFTDGGGKRFRAPFNSRTVGGIRFSDYENYKELNDNLGIEDYDTEYNQDKLGLLSKIELENLEVQIP
jgi:hypothetical protein